MKTFSKFVINCLLILILGVSFGLISWHLISYLPYKNEIEKELSKSKTEYGNELSEIPRLVIAAESEKGVGWFIARRSYYALSFQNAESRGNLKWHLNSTLWYFSNTIYFDKEEQLYLYLHLAHTNELSQKYYQANLNQLNFEQQAQIISMVKAPNVFIPGSERAQMRLEWVLKNYKGL